MALRDILVCLDPTDAGENRLRLAASIARQHHAHLSAAYVISAQDDDTASHGMGAPAPSAAAAGIGAGSLVAGIPAPSVPPAQDLSRGAGVADIVEHRFREELRPHAIEGDWHLFDRGEADQLVMLLRSFDLAVVGQTSSDHPVAAMRADALVVECGRPLLVVPYAGAFASLGERVLVAWDGTREASRALHDALPLLAPGASVTVLTVRNREARFERDRPGLDRIAHHLQRHGFAVKAEETLRGDLAISDVILSRAADVSADLIVSGAYHHSPMREAMFGGVSRELLQHMTVPVLMSH